MSFLTIFIDEANYRDRDFSSMEWLLNEIERYEIRFIYFKGLSTPLFICLLVVVLVRTYCSFYIHIFLSFFFCFLYVDIHKSNFIGLVGRAFANSPGDQGPIPRHVISKTLKNGS